MSSSVAAKYQDEEIRSNEFYAEAGSVKVEELDMLEVASLELLGWNSEMNVCRAVRLCLVATCLPLWQRRCSGGRL